MRSWWSGMISDTNSWTPSPLTGLKGWSPWFQRCWTFASAQTTWPMVDSVETAKGNMTSFSWAIQHVLVLAMGDSNITACCMDACGSSPWWCSSSWRARSGARLWSSLAFFVGNPSSSSTGRLSDGSKSDDLFVSKPVTPPLAEKAVICIAIGAPFAGSRLFLEKWSGGTMLAVMFPPLPLAILSFILACVAEIGWQGQGFPSSMLLLTLPCWASCECTPGHSGASDACLGSWQTDSFSKSDEAVTIGRSVHHSDATLDALVHQMLSEIESDATLDALVHRMLSDMGSDAALDASVHRMLLEIRSGATLDASVHRMLPDIGSGATLDASVHRMPSETGSDATLYASANRMLSGFGSGATLDASVHRMLPEIG